MIYSGNVGVNIANATVTAHSTITYFQIGIPFPLRARTLLTKNIPPQIKPTILISAKFPRLLTNGEYDWNRHHNAVVTKGFPVFRLHQSESAIVSYQAFGKKDEEIPFESKLDFARNKDRNPLPKGSYYTQFELNLNAQGETPSEGSKGIVCKKSFTIE